MDALDRLRSAPERAAVLLDVDGTLAPIAERPEDAAVPEETRAVLRDLVARHGKSVIAVTHDLNLAAQMHRRIHIVDGRVEKDEQVAAPEG
jgi:trehalose-phosphatase